MTIPSMMCGIGSDAFASTVTTAGFGVDLQREADHDRAEVERADLRAGDRDDRERRAVIRAGEIDLARGVGEDGADAGADERMPDFARGGARRVASSCAPVTILAASMSASGQNGIPDRFAVSPGGRIEEKRVISCSPSLRVMWMLHRAVGARTVVQRPRDQTGVERWDAARGAGAAADTVFDLEGAVRRERSSAAQTTASVRLPPYTFRTPAG